MQSPIQATELFNRFENLISAYGLINFFRALISQARELKTSVYLVGGSVRDLLLDRSSPDLDFVVEGDAIGLARAVAEQIGARHTEHRRFGTAHLRERGIELDLATARSEQYPQPGSLPVVQAANLTEDLARRDFTVNAMALALTGPQRGELIDPCDGLNDLSLRAIRVLHDVSFVDDATRILRAVRYEVRLEFQIEPHTLALLQRDKGYLLTVNPARLRLEFQRILHEQAPEQALKRCQELGVLAEVHADLTFHERLVEAFKAARGEVKSPVNVYLALLALSLTSTQAVGLAARIASTKAQREAIEATPLALRSIEALTEGARPHQIVKTLQSYPQASLWAVALAAAHARSRELARIYLQKWRHVRSLLRGSDLQALGVPSGPKIGQTLERLRGGRLDGRLHTRDDEVRFVQDLVHHCRGGQDDG